MKNAYFITGTDTDAGKTLVGCALLTAAARQGLSTLALKPVAAGCEEQDDGLRNPDALQLMEAMSLALPYQAVNPVALAPPIAPHIAAQKADYPLALAPLVAHCRQQLARPADLVLIEGAGGWRLPLNDQEYLSGLPQALALPVILVVGMKLGCLNHALLTVEAIQRDGLVLAGWVANQVDPEMAVAEENLQTLKQQMPAPFLGRVPHLLAEQDRVQAASRYLDIGALTPAPANRRP